MANTLSTTKMTNPIRGLVSKRRIRYTQDGFDLDLTYINDRIIAMGYPAEHMESIYRNKIEDVQKMLEKNHAGCYKIYNLCSERSYNHKRFPYYSVYPFKDHNPPDIELITSFCRDVDEHLRADSKNVVAVHCKAGKGRTGTMICCYLLYSRQFNTAGEALNYYAQRRTSDSKGVTIPSQRRYVEYYATLLRSNETYRPMTLYICEIRLIPALSIKEGTINVTGNDPQSLPEFKRTDDHTAAKLDYCMPLAGDVKIEFVKSSVLRKEKRCHFWFNTYFVEKSARKDADGNLLLVLSKSEIDDAHKDKHHKEYPNNFTVEVVLRRVPTGKYSESVSLKKCQSPTAVTTSPLIKCGMENNRQQHITPQQILLQQQHQSPLQLQQQHPPLLRQMSSDPYRPTIIKHQHSYIDGNTNSVVSGGFLHDQHHHLQQQQQQQQNPLPTHQNNHHNHHHHHHHHHHQLQQLPTQQRELNYQSMHENNQQYLDENNHCLEYSETSSSESSTEEEGWDSGECPTLLLAPPDKANLYYRNDNYYYGSCAGLSADPCDPSGSSPRLHPAPHLPTSVSSALISSSTPLITVGSVGVSVLNISRIEAKVAAKHNLSNSSRISSNTVGSSKLNSKSLANATSAASTSSKLSVVLDDSSGVFSSASLRLQDSLLSLAKSQLNCNIGSSSSSCNSCTSSSSSSNSSDNNNGTSNNNNGTSNNNNGKLPSSTEPLTNQIAATSTNSTAAWSSPIGLKRKTRKSFKSNVVKSGTVASKEFGSGASVTSQGKVKSGKSRFHKFRWLKNLRSDPNLKNILAKKGADLMTLTQSNLPIRTPSPPSTTIPIAAESLTRLLPTASNENFLSLDYYSSICDKQLSFESPSKSPGRLMKLNLARKRLPEEEDLPDGGECTIVIAKPSEQRLTIGFDVSPSQTPTTKVAPDNLISFGTVEKSVCDQNESTVEPRTIPRSYSLVPKSENTSFCDRILQTFVGGVGNPKKPPSADHELRVPQSSCSSSGNSPVAPRANRSAPFSLRELRQELKSVIRPSSSSSSLQPKSPTKAAGSAEEESISKKAD
ncbi:serine-rich adhesin for platelets isoform X1 [Toxorhynchites rutilus septentrionalis]|uniref:serine-rich adhesin for platelets isoform X1 n=1 Tax=Toxorhynchites rutilus septentrionalis TaxID=329112 RepID=UPI00247AB9A3|nr:serine-rich adhesin for platelets isoform X1 [Toxorhynchites rutilus septentrionalis]XP_055642874.1 serine-rich adhesin for platelets isoform X1 [Toxorhynchites rutilus septentrionalis]XP_055642875.1 serine-rich adhesin for platelets isoform X1 [Toxorhynchites rutilus septentrionalis]XP_055642876.1 serine-rich adhesin for platelets isoform X1 [Toxorhynchites rutilus septentrionalis]XP_055642877.1 serine-rich adhesin for platelets isoform X1 [Toxorhynchites rutilus septentrionalis]XP_0556428